MPRANPNSLLERPPPCRLAPVAEPVWGGFPRLLTPFLDRTEAIAPMRDPLRDPGQRLITLLGPGGVGKPRRVIAASAALGVRGQAGLTIEQSLVAAIQMRRLLLGMDNVEQVIGLELRTLITPLLESCPKVTILATSRVPLQMQQAQRVAVAPFAGPAGGERSRETARNLNMARRDVEGVRLLNAGQTDREIDASLVIREPSAFRHVGAALQKLGVSSRSEAAAQGMKLGLDCGGRRATR